MRVGVGTSVLFLSAMLGSGGAAWAFEGVAVLAQADQPGAPADPVLEAFRSGAQAYNSGNLGEAVQQLEFAAERGHPAAQWRLGQMYAEGEGVTEDDARAFEYFAEVIKEHPGEAPSSQDAPFVAGAYVEIGAYLITGITAGNLSLPADPEQAREIFIYAASYYGDPDAQYQLGRMYLQGLGGEQDGWQAARWLLLAARNGHIDAQALLGDVLSGGQDGVSPEPVEGLMWLTIALARDAEDGMPEAWIREAHERAFSVATAEQRDEARQRAETWLGRPIGEAGLGVIPPQVAVAQ